MNDVKVEDNMAAPSHLVDKSTSELLSLYNEKARELGKPPVRRFADRSAALKRTTAILNGAEGQLPLQDEQVKADPPEAFEIPETFEMPEADRVVDTGKGVDHPEPINETTTTTTETSTTEQETDMATKAKKTAKKPAKKAAAKKTVKKAAKKAGGGRKREEGALVGKGTNREKLLAIFEANKSNQVPISKLMKAVYGESHKDLKGPLMMVIKGLGIVFKTNKLALEIRKTRENKENYFGLYKKA